MKKEERKIDPQTVAGSTENEWEQEFCEYTPRYHRVQDGQALVCFIEPVSAVVFSDQGKRRYKALLYSPNRAEKIFETLGEAVFFLSRRGKQVLTKKKVSYSHALISSGMLCDSLIQRDAIHFLVFNQKVTPQYYVISVHFDGHETVRAYQTEEDAVEEITKTALLWGGQKN